MKQFALFFLVFAFQPTMQRSVGQRFAYLENRINKLEKQLKRETTYRKLLEEEIDELKKGNSMGVTDMPPTSSDTYGVYTGAPEMPKYTAPDNLPKKVQKLEATMGEFSVRMDKIEGDALTNMTNIRDQVFSLIDDKSEEMDNELRKLKKEDGNLEQRLVNLEEKCPSQPENKNSILDKCSFDGYTFDADDVVIGGHKRTYPGLTHLPLEFFQSADGVALLNKFAQEHNYYYGFRKTVINGCVLCTKDNKNLAYDTENVYVTASNSTGDSEGCPGRILNYRVRLCDPGPVDKYGHPYTRGVCNNNWNSIRHTPRHDNTCLEQTEKNRGRDALYFGLFMKTKVYNKFNAVCDFTNQIF